jgi:putative membrane protein
MVFLARLLVVALALMGVAYLVPGIEIASLYTAIIAAVVLGLLNIFVRPILLILTFPITLLTLGLSTFIINGFLFWFAASFIDGMRVDGFVSAFVGALIISVVSTVAHRVLS